MRIAVLQCEGAGGHWTSAQTRLRDALAVASNAGCNLLVAPELMMPGYNCAQAHADHARAFDAMSRDLSTMAAEAGCALVTGWAERDGDALYNAATAIGAHGEVLAHHRKRLLFGEMERATFRTGSGAPCLFDYQGRRFGLLICYEIEFPEPARDLARQGAEVILVPTANPAGFEHVQRYLLPARAHENRGFVVYANYCGSENGLTFGGQSCVVGPDGAAILSAGGTPALLIGDLPTLGAYPEGVLSTQLQDLC